MLPAAILLQAGKEFIALPMVEIHGFKTLMLGVFIRHGKVYVLLITTLAMYAARVEKFLKQLMVVQLGKTKPVMVQVTPVSSTAETIQQYLYYVNKADKPTLLDHLLQDKTILSALVFARTKHGADKVTKFQKAW